jgi:hypothetical protein
MPVTARMLGIVALGTFASPVLGADDFPLVGTYTENQVCKADSSDASVSRVKITGRQKRAAPPLRWPSALAALRLITKSNLSSAAGLFTFRQRRLHPQSSDGIARWISSWSLHSSSNVNV